MKIHFIFCLLIMGTACCCPKSQNNCTTQCSTTSDSLLTSAPNTFIFLAEGFEEIEAIAPLDILRRGGVNVHTVSITENKQVKGSNGLIVNADYTLNDIKDVETEMMILPGGFDGSKNLSQSDTLMTMLAKQYTAGKNIAAICAAPAFIFSKLPIADSIPLTVYPDAGLIDMLKGKNIVDKGIVSYNQIITGKGPGYSYDFGYTILEKLKGYNIATELAKGMLYKENK